MQVYTLTLVRFDYDRFDDLENVGTNLEKLIEERAHPELPVYSHDKDTYEFIDWGEEEGGRGYIWQEWEVDNNAS